MLWAPQDQRRLLESRHDLDAADALRELVALKAIEDALRRLAEARQHLLELLRAYRHEVRETDAARQQLNDILEVVLRYYGTLRGRAQVTLLRVESDESSSADEREAYSELVDALFTLSPRQLAERSLLRRASTLIEIADRLRSEVWARGLDEDDEFEEQVEHLRKAMPALVRERGEDAESRAELERARQDFDAAARDYHSCVMSALNTAGQRDEAGRFLKAQQSLYQARRLHRIPIEVEAGIEDIWRERASRA